MTSRGQLCEGHRQTLEPLPQGNQRSPIYWDGKTIDQIILQNSTSLKQEGMKETQEERSTDKNTENPNTEKQTGDKIVILVQKTQLS